LLDANNLRLRILGQQLEKEQVKIDVNKNLIARYKAEIGVLIDQVRLYEAQMHLAEKLTKLDAIELELFKEETDAFVASVGAITERAKQQTILAEVDVIKAELLGKDSAYQELIALRTAVQIELQAARERFDALSSAIILRSSSLGEIETALNDKEDAINELKDARIIEIDNRLALDKSGLDITKDKAGADKNQDMDDANMIKTIATKEKTSQQTIAGYQTTPYQAEQLAAFLEYWTELEVIDILKKAEIVNKFIEEVGTE
ncbi:MAG: hypothetical protein ABIJ08_05000, partial [Nanoarchaeota archaeon]